MVPISIATISPTAMMVAAFGAKMVFVALYLVVMLRLVGVEPMPFAASFTSYFVLLYAIEAIYLKRMFEGGPGGEYNWALPIALVGFLALAAGTRSPVSALRILIASALIWGLSTFYFLTHKVTTGYYQIPAVFAAMSEVNAGHERSYGYDPVTAEAEKLFQEVLEVRRRVRGPEHPDPRLPLIG